VERYFNLQHEIFIKFNNDKTYSEVGSHVGGVFGRSGYYRFESNMIILNDTSTFCNSSGVFDFEFDPITNNVKYKDSSTRNKNLSIDTFLIHSTAKDIKLSRISDPLDFYKWEADTAEWYWYYKEI
jgi:hypothetical protein